MREGVDGGMCLNLLIRCWVIDVHKSVEREACG